MTDLPDLPLVLPDPDVPELLDLALLVADDDPTATAQDGLDAFDETAEGDE